MGLASIQPGAFSQRQTMYRTLPCIVLTLLMLIPVFGQESKPAAKFGDDVVAKADKIFADAGLRRSGKTIATNLTADVSRGMTTLARSRRSLKMVNDTWKQTAAQISLLSHQAELLTRQNIDLNTRLARPLLDASTNNQLVGMINANVSKLKLYQGEHERLQAKLALDRKAVNDAEAEYAETVLGLRRNFNVVKEQLEQKLQDDPVKVALRVYHANFETPDIASADAILFSVERRLQQIEQEIFSESIALDVSSGSLYVNVVVGEKSTRMIVDSGATIVSLPASTAAELGVTIPADAPVLRLVLADGREIPGRAVTLAKVRIGQFEAENVQAAVLDAVATNAEPLLGMSFLGNFKFEIDVADKSLKLLRVGAE